MHICRLYICSTDVRLNGMFVRIGRLFDTCFLYQWTAAYGDRLYVHRLISVQNNRYCNSAPLPTFKCKSCRIDIALEQNSLSKKRPSDKRPSDKCPLGEESVTTNVHWKKPPVEQVSSNKCPSNKCLSNKCPKLSGTKSSSLFFLNVLQGLPHIEISTTLERALLSAFETPEITCVRCNKKVEGTKTWVITEPPAVLYLTLKRFPPNQTKNSFRMSYPKTLNITPFVEVTDNPTPRQWLYKLRSVVCHSGDCVVEGHYVTVAGELGNTYKLFDDQVC